MRFSQLRILAALFGSLIGLLQCTSSNSDDSTNAAYTQYISAFTTGIISAEDDIIISLVNNNAAVKPNSVVEDQSIFEISPKVKGTLIWETNRTLKFVPEDRLASGTQYSVSIALDELVDVPNSLATFSFNFQTISQSIYVQHQGQEAYDENNLRWQQLTGTVQFSDVVSETELRQVFEAKQNGNLKSISFVSSGDGKNFTFQIDSVHRKETPEKVTLMWDGEPIDAEEQGEITIDIPRLGDFKVISASASSGEDQAITVHFSDPLSKNQNLSGLLYLENGATVKVSREGNAVMLYPESRQSGTVKLHVNSAVKNILGYKLLESFTTTLVFESLQPAVEFLGDGVIVPNGQDWKVPFRAVNLSGVNVKVIRVYEENVAQFFQVNQYHQTRELKRVGRLVLNKEFPLTQDNSLDYGTWNQFALDLSAFVKTEPGAIYRVILSFEPHQSLYDCDEAVEDLLALEDADAIYDKPLSTNYYYYDAGRYDRVNYKNYRWKERDNPCKPSYYYNPDRVVAKNFIASNFGIIAKVGSDQNYHFAVSDLNTASPVSGVALGILDYQGKEIQNLKTDQNGFASIQCRKKPFLVVAQKGNEKGYLRIDDQQALSTSMFDVSGTQVQEGLKGMIYGERGVWRPGDTLFLSFMLNDAVQPLPKGHPIVFELTNSRNQLVKRIVGKKKQGVIYNFTTTTEPDDPTGNWLAKVTIGNAVFTKTVKVETVKPNRLKVNLSFPGALLKGGEQAKLASSWLHGAPARNLKARVQAVISPNNGGFKGYPGYHFSNSMVSLDHAELEIFDGQLDENGQARFDIDLDLEKENLPGLVNVRFKNRVFERGGNFSSDFEVFQFSPFSSYVGVKLPDTKNWGNAINSDKAATIALETVDENGDPVSRKNLEVAVYDIRWRWWWDRSSDEQLGSYIRNHAQALLFTDKAQTTNGKGTYTLRFPAQSWGRKLIVITDPVSGHKTAKTFYTTYSSWRGDDSDMPGGAEMLQLVSNRNTYNVGETASVELPVLDKARALVAVENGTTVLQKFWVDINKENNRIQVPIKAGMAPNVYLNITLIQPHVHNNDLPIRQYGILPITVRDKETILEPVVRLPKVIKPESEYTIAVSEKNDKAMSYTLAVIDEGLLDITKFRTPDPHKTFFAKEALGVYSWDMYSYVSGAIRGEIAGLLSIGGDEAGKGVTDAKANRFKPVVRFLGPFAVEAGETAQHTLSMDNYVGSVRAMVVAGNSQAYGKAEAVAKVKKPLMVLATVPRVLAPNESIDLPVTVFAMDEKVNKVDIRITTNSLFTVNQSKKEIQFNEVGDQTHYFKLAADSALGIGKIQVEVRGAGEKAQYEVELDIRAANPPVSKTQSWTVTPGETLDLAISNYGMPGTNSHTVTVSGLPDFGYSERYQYLLQYPYGCIEQTTSSAFPQLYVDGVVDLNTAEKNKIRENVLAAINRLQHFQLPSGGMGYWPGASYVSYWGTNYAGHFMLEAKKEGYPLPIGFVERWQSFQSQAANTWDNQDRYDNDLTQAYRLFTLALSGKPALGAMNRMRESGDYSKYAKWRLAAAYALCGKTNAATEILKAKSEANASSKYRRYTYGNQSRDLAMLLETLVIMGQESVATDIFQDLAKAMRSEEFYTTQSAAYGLIAAAKYIDKYVDKGSAKFDWATQSENGSKALGGKIWQKPVNAAAKTTINNTGGQTLFVNVVSTGTPRYGTEKSVSNYMSISTRYTLLDGTPVDETQLKQGTDFIAEVTVRHSGQRNRLNDVALSQIFPSGWEILNTRLNDEAITLEQDIFDYQDVRDDRVYTFFGLASSESKTFKVMLNAAYTGKFYLPAVSAEAMYQRDINAQQAGRWVTVVPN